MKSRQDIERYLKEVRKEQASLEKEGLDYRDHLVKINLLSQILKDGDWER